MMLSLKLELIECLKKEDKKFIKKKKTINILQMSQQLIKVSK